MLDRDIRLDFTGHEQTVSSRHSTTPTPQHITGPHTEPYPGDRDGQWVYIALRIEWGTYAIPIRHLKSPPENQEEINVDRVVWHDDRLKLEAPLDTGEILLLTEEGLTQREHPFWHREITTSRIPDPDVVLWERE